MKRIRVGTKVQLSFLNKPIGKIILRRKVGNTDIMALSLSPFRYKSEWDDGDISGWLSYPQDFRVIE